MQVPAFMGYKSAQAASLAGVIVCLATLVVYCIFQARPSCWLGVRALDHAHVPCFLPGMHAHLYR